MDSITVEAQQVTEQFLEDLFYRVEVELAEASSKRFQPTDVKVLRDSMKATAAAAAYALRRRAIDLAFAGKFDARALMDAAHIKFVSGGF